MSNFDVVFQQMQQRLAAIENGTSPAVQQVLKQANSAAAAARHTQKLFEQAQQHNEQVTQILQHMSIEGGETGRKMSDSDRVQFIEDIPGRRVPQDQLAEIPIDADINTQQQQQIPISNFGPFVARSRYISFISMYRFSVTDSEGQSSADFSGRSFGRFRAPHSAQDIMDGHLPPVQSFGGAPPGGGDPLWASTVLHSPYRTMQPDARIEVSAESDGFPRQNKPVPSAFWTTGINSPFALPALDFFDRNESIAIKLTPLHINNPAAGNLTGFPGVSPYPFLGQEYDHHEGIVDTFTQGADTDPVTRLPSGLFVLGFCGYRILQAPAALGGIS